MELKQLYNTIDANRDEMMSLWEKLVNIDCGSGNKAGVDAVGQIIADYLQPLSIPVRFYRSEKSGNMLVAEYGNMRKPFVAFIGHMDTVFKDGTVAQRPFTIKDGKAYGPGVLDMKGGITIALSVLKAMKENGYINYPIKLILAGDEEVAHQNSNAVAFIKEECRGAVAAFNFETGFMDNSVVVERKGVFRAIFEVYGRGAHAGNSPQDGRSAIKEMAYKILELEELTNFEEGNTVNVGVIEGGTVANAIPAYCKTVVDVRFVDEASEQDYKEKFKAIAAVQHVPDTTTKLTFPVVFSAMSKMAATMDLFEKVNTILVEEGFAAIHPIKVGGGSDSAYSVSAGVPTLCAMGVQGTGNHTVDETADVESLFTRAKMMLAIMGRLRV